MRNLISSTIIITLLVLVSGLALALPAITSAQATLRGWQLDATNTGLAGVGVDRNRLPVYNGPSKPAAGTTIRLQKITLSELDLSNGNITLDRVWVKPTGASGRGSMIFGYNPNTGGNQLGPVTIMDSDIDASSVTDPYIYASCAFRGAGNLYRNRMWGMGSGICFFGSPSVPTAVIEQNYVDGMRGGIFSGQQSHNESATIRSFGGTSLTWRNNKLISKSGSDSGSLFIQAWAGYINNVLLEGNVFDTYGYDLPLEPSGNGYGTNMRARDNRFGTSGYGVGYVNGGPGWAEWTNNFLYVPTNPDAKGAAASCPGGPCVSGH